MQGNNKILCTSLYLHSLTAVVGSSAFEVLRNPLEVTAFPSCVAIFLLPQLVPLSQGLYCLPLSSPNFMCLTFSWILPGLSCSMAFKAPADTWTFCITCLGLFYLNTRLCSQVTLDCISHKTQAFVVLLFQSLSQTASLVHRHTPSPKNCK